MHGSWQRIHFVRLNMLLVKRKCRCSAVRFCVVSWFLAEIGAHHTLLGMPDAQTLHLSTSHP